MATNQIRRLLEEIIWKSTVHDKLDQIIRQLTTFNQRINTMSGATMDFNAELTQLLGVVQSQTTVIGGMQTFLGQLAARNQSALDAAKAAGATAEQLVQMSQLHDAVMANTTAITNAIVANTPAAPEGGPVNVVSTTAGGPAGTPVAPTPDPTPAPSVPGGTPAPEPASTPPTPVPGGTPAPEPTP